ncbi:hypothetical protein niasHT_020327 [Heterodera trifolii]|uniref:Secreted protein n=1 Tax=Heterodera trifolii TaxID=157864 RepID=A0ABD2K4C0_9BILA
MCSKFAFFVIFAATVFLLFLLDEALAGGTSSKHKAGAKRDQRVTLNSHLKSGQPKQIGMGVKQEPREQILKTTKERYQARKPSHSKEFQQQHFKYDKKSKDNGSTTSENSRRGGTSSNNCTIL